MLASDFSRKLRKLNRSLHIYCGDDASKPAGIWHMDEGEPMPICGVPKNYVNEWSRYTPQGKMIVSGWNRILRILVAQKLIDRHESYKHFGYWTEHREPFLIVETTEIDSSIKDLEARGTPVEHENPLCPGERIASISYRKDDMIDVGRLIAKGK